MEFGGSSKKKVISSLRQLQGLSGQKKIRCKKKKQTQTKQPESKGKASSLSARGEFGKGSQQASVPAGEAQRGRAVAWQPRKRYGSWGISWRFSAASSATD